MALQQSFPPMALILAQPQRYFRAGRSEQVRNFTAGMSLVVEQNGVNSPSDAVRTVPFRLAFESPKLLSPLSPQLEKSRAHAKTIRQISAFVPLFMRVYVVDHLSVRSFFVPFDSFL